MALFKDEQGITCFVSDIPERNEVQENGDDQQDDKCKPGEKWNAKVEHILNTL